MTKSQAAEQFRKAMQMLANSLDEDKAMMISTVYDKWCANKEYKSGEYITYGLNNVGDPQLYKVVQQHTSSVGWMPGSAPSLYTPVGLSNSGVALWSQPTGAHDAYNVGDVVEHGGVKYESVVDGNVWEPSLASSYWKIV